MKGYKWDLKDRRIIILSHKKGGGVCIQTNEVLKILKEFKESGNLINSIKKLKNEFIIESDISTTLYYRRTCKTNEYKKILKEKKNLKTFELNQVLKLSKEGFSITEISKSLKISYQKTHRIINKNRVVKDTSTYNIFISNKESNLIFDLAFKIKSITGAIKRLKENGLLNVKVSNTTYKRTLIKRKWFIEC